jgi:DNA polymerase III subunit epsilon
MTKLLFFDLETTGVNHRKNGIHQISGLVDIDGIIKEEFDFKVRPNPQAVIEEEALKVGGVTREQIEAYTPMRTVYNQFTEILARYVGKFDKKDKFHLVGYNNREFDDPFLRAWFVQNFDDYFGSWFWADSLDCLVLSSYVLREERAKLQDFKLKTVAKYLGITVDETKLHDARYDIGLTREIFYKLPQYGQESNRQDRLAA